MSSRLNILDSLALAISQRSLKKLFHAILLPQEWQLGQPVPPWPAPLRSLSLADLCGSARRNPRKFTGCFLSAPISPRRTTEWYKEEAKINFSERSLIPFDWEENQGNPRKITDNEEDTVDDKQKVKSFTRVSHDSLPLFLCLKRSLPSLLIVSQTTCSYETRCRVVEL
ncbi:hypothetical protein IGI04_026783 [Brassica rapa subsp. trilocularis]|uniref:Ig-like domain-containing protein n=1 Tax=Brassica rapa subsp. trilocularis TaxID=1813537 RepID=A0ABQ7KZK8_BRACM|nr:hypothetical protein IGI04_026783 [Brassica rapa subsp. trilocularis]